MESDSRGWAANGRYWPRYALSPGALPEKGRSSREVMYAVRDVWTRTFHHGHCSCCGCDEGRAPDEGCREPEATLGAFDGQSE